METQNQLNILFFSPTVPYPAIDGGRIRVLNLVSRLCRIHKVTLLTFITLPTDEQGIDYMRRMGMAVAGVRLSGQNSTMSYRSLLRSFIQRKPVTVVKYYCTDMVAVLKNLLKSRSFDIIHFEMIHTGQYLMMENDIYHSAKTVLGEQNIDSNVWYRLSQTEANPLKKLTYYSQYRAFAKYESKICGEFDACTCVSTQDREKLMSICPEASIDVIPNGVDLDYFKPGDLEEDAASLVFTGSMDWHPNEDAVLYFCDYILPIIRVKLPEVRFYIVGSNPTPRVLDLRRIEGVIVTGSVEDVRPYIARGAVYVVPIRVGGGTRLKILQALAMEKAVVSTTIGCEGQELQPGQHLLAADEPQQFANAVIRLIKDKALRRRLGENGRAFVKERYDWDVIVRKLDLLYRKLVFT